MAGHRILQGVVLFTLLLGGCRNTVVLTDAPGQRQAPPGASGAPEPATPVDGPAVATPTPADPPPPPPELDPMPTEGKHGVPAPLPGVYTDLGPADRSARIRGLVGLPIRDVAQLEATIRSLYDPGSPDFRRYLTPAEWIRRHAPSEQDVRIVTDWLESQGFTVPDVATNRLLIHFQGTVGQFNDAFGVDVRVLERKSPQAGNPPHEVYGLIEAITVPRFIEERITAVVTLDLDELAGRVLPPEATSPVGPPENLEDGYTPQQIARAYNVDALYAQGFRGRGVKLGVLVGGTFHSKDVRAFWETFGIARADPLLVDFMGGPRLRIREANLDVQWAGAIAPEADLVVFRAPDARNTSMVFAFNEAISRGEVSVLTDSFAHREDSEPRAVRRQYSASAMMAAALGITVTSASGDSAGVDVPSSSPYVTAVGGTLLGMIGMDVVWETAWEYSGSGISLTLEVPEWQVGLPGVTRKRAVVDVALNAGMGYWYMMLGRWYSNIGTSFSSPVFAALVAVVNEARAAQGRPPLGFINSLLYTRPEVQRTFRDITVGGTPKYSAGPGWDMPTGWGAPDAEGLLRTMP